MFCRVLSLSKEHITASGSQGRREIIHEKFLYSISAHFIFWTTLAYSSKANSVITLWGAFPEITISFYGCEVLPICGLTGPGCPLS
jgi:hypothetical protein